MDRDKLKIIIPLLSVILVIAFFAFSADQDEEVEDFDQVETSQKDVPIKKTYEDISLGNSEKKPPTKVKPLKKVAPQGNTAQRRKALEEDISKLTGRLEKCREQVSEIVREEDIQKIEKHIWAMEDSEKKVTPIELKEAESEILEKLGSLTSMEWHMNELGDVTEKLMNEELAMSDPDWTLDVGAKIQPCGVYQAHRLLSIWTELVPPAKKNSKEVSFVEESVVNYTKNMLKHSLGAAGVAMQLELMAALSEKGYFNEQMRNQIGELERRMHEEMDARFEDTDGNPKDLVQSVVRDFQENETARQDAMDVINQHYPDY